MRLRTLAKFHHVRDDQDKNRETKIQTGVLTYVCIGGYTLPASVCVCLCISMESCVRMSKVNLHDCHIFPSHIHTYIHASNIADLISENRKMRMSITVGWLVDVLVLGVNDVEIKLLFLL